MSEQMKASAHFTVKTSEARGGYCAFPKGHSKRETEVGPHPGFTTSLVSLLEDPGPAETAGLPWPGNPLPWTHCEQGL